MEDTAHAQKQEPAQYGQPFRNHLPLPIKGLEIYFLTVVPQVVWFTPAERYENKHALDTTWNSRKSSEE